MDDLVELMSLEEMHQREGNGQTSWDQFSVNKERFGVESQFDEGVYTMPMSSLQINPEEWEEVVRTAREIEREEGENGQNDEGRRTGRTMGGKWFRDRVG